jgi:hypothetical protein
MGFIVQTALVPLPIKVKGISYLCATRARAAMIDTMVCFLSSMTDASRNEPNLVIRSTTYSSCDIEMVRASRLAISCDRHTQDPFELALVLGGEACREISDETGAKLGVVVGDKGVVNIDTDPKDRPLSLEDVEAVVDRRLRHAPRREEGGEEGSPLSTILFEAIKGSPQLTHERVPVPVEGEYVRGRAHVKWHVGVKETLQVGLSDVNRREIIIPSRSEQKDETDCGRLET